MKGTSFGVPVPLSTEQIRTEVVARFVYAANYAYEVGEFGVLGRGIRYFSFIQINSKLVLLQNCCTALTELMQPYKIPTQTLARFQASAVWN